MEKNPNKKILLDADVISHFIATGNIHTLFDILEPYPAVILDKVYAEISKLPKRKQLLDIWVDGTNLTIIPFPGDNEEINKEYADLKRRWRLIGNGERACMAVARHTNDIIASSNFKDIEPFCNLHDIEFLGTIDLLSIALKKGILSVEECNDFIVDARRENNARFPKHVKVIGDYKCTKLNLFGLK
ncbi:MAG TPA: hypothetical protein VIK55_20755 [Paludibacter sp.]